MDISYYNSIPFDISREKKTHSSIPSLHYHDAFEILYIVSGDLYYSIEDKNYQVVGGVLLLINMRDKHRLMNTNGAMYERVTLLFQEQFLQSFQSTNVEFDPLSCFRSGSNAIKLAGREQEFIEGLFHKMISEDSKRLSGYDYYRKALLIELLIFIQRKLDDGQRYDLIESNRAHKPISQVVNFINQNYNQRLTLDDLSKKFFLSSSYLSRTFKSATGYTFIEYINNIRVKEARTLLESSQLSISDIAESVGYGNLTHFGRTFKSVTGFSPLKYRQKKVGRSSS
ncbi:AraC family transcriptional regulator [Cohnella sp. WQ 127256]|uniref:AraC family transcriptional regulator n=1 Tax=Cohnella sp. WQ 127256 TaxID=2938790 RepID=UPI002117E187|nr:AraC family transcriptional regulator [Cohnella sp. WQ 127256]